MLNYSWADRLIIHIDQGIKTLFAGPRVAARPTPGNDLPDTSMTKQEQQQVAGLMRVNHAGEVSAQALYQGQALTARLEHVRAKMQQACEEETDHLAWCEQRLSDLASYPSHLNVIWYSGSLIIGALAGLAGDRWSLGFVAETERQVVNHLQEHLQRLPKHDAKSEAILKQMQVDESHHATLALAAGGAELPDQIKHMMRLMSKIMTSTAYYV